MKSIALFLAIIASACCMAQQSSQQAQHASGLPQDWSHRYVTYAGSLTTGRMSNPRAVSSWLQHLGRGAVAARSMATAVSKKGKKTTGKRVDWNVSLGSATANLPPFGYPAKFSFDMNAVPSCADDF